MKYTYCLVVDPYHCILVEDPYRWPEDGMAWLSASSFRYVGHHFAAEIFRPTTAG